MSFYKLTILSRKKDEVKDFMEFFLHIQKQKNLNFISKQLGSKKKKKIFSILKSPHVNKKAQEQFELKFHKKQITFEFIDNHKSVMIAKRLKNLLFPSLSIKIAALLNKNLEKNRRARNLNIHDVFFSFSTVEFLGNNCLKKTKLTKFCTEFKPEITEKYTRRIYRYGESVSLIRVWIAQLVRAKD